MPVYRTPDGRIVEERTEVTPPGGKPSGLAGDDATGATRKTDDRTGGGAPRPARGRTGYDETTVVHRPGAGTRATETARRGGTDSERTVLVGAIPRGDKQTSAAEEVDPVTGWLVVLDGPGKSRDVRIGAGRNALGRDSSNRVALPFGDTQISREKHLWIAYDHRNRTFSVAPGDGSANLAYLNDTPIDQRLPLPDGATIAIGKTTLRFVAFCGDTFDWSDADR